MQMVMMVFRTSLGHDILPLVEDEQLPFTRLDGLQGKGIKVLRAVFLGR